MKEGWEYKTLGEVCKIYNGNSINADYKKKNFLGATGGLPFIATKDVSPLGTIDYNNGVRIPNYEEYKVAPANSVFICAEGGSAGKKFAYVEKDVCFGNKLFCITPKDKAIKGKFIYHFVQSDNFRGQFFSLLTGLIGGVSAKKFQKIEIPVPSLSEQQSIVDYLDAAFAKIDAMKANAEKALNEAKALFQASLKEMLEPKEGWEEKILQDICSDIVDCPHTTPQKVGFPTQYPCIRTSELKGGRIDWSTMQYLDEDEYKKRVSRLVPKANDLVYGREGTYGDAVLLPDGYSFSLGQRTMLLRPNEIYIIPRFFLYSMISPHVYQQAKAKNSGCGVGHVNVKDIKVFRIGLPTIEIQLSIVDTLDSLKSKVDRLQANYDKISKECDALKQAILRQVFE